MKRPAIQDQLYGSQTDSFLGDIFCFILSLYPLLLYSFGLWMLTVSYLGGIIVLAVSLCVQQLALHECGHLSLFPSRRYPLYQNVLGNIYGGLICMPFYSYRRGHNKHHLWVGVRPGPDGDPSGLFAWSESTVAKYSYKLFNTTTVDQFRKFTLPLFTIGMRCGYFLYDIQKQRRQTRHVVQWAWGVALSILFLVIQIIFLSWLLDTNILTATFTVGICQYLGWVCYEPLSLSMHLGLQVPKLPTGRKFHDFFTQSLYARTVFLPWFVPEALMFHFNYHKEHHIYPNLFHGYLPKVYQILSKEHPEIYNCDSNMYWVQKQMTPIVKLATLNGQKD